MSERRTIRLQDGPNAITRKAFTFHNINADCLIIVVMQSPFIRLLWWSEGEKGRAFFFETFSSSEVTLFIFPLKDNYSCPVKGCFLNHITSRQTNFKHFSIFEASYEPHMYNIISLLRNACDCVGRLSTEWVLQRWLTGIVWLSKK